MDFTKIIYKILEFIGWLLYFIKKPFKWFFKLNWKSKIIIIIILLMLFDKLRFWLFNLIVWVLK